MTTPLTGRIKQAHLSPRGHHDVLGKAEVAGLRKPGERRIDRETFAQAYPSARLTEPGDILVTMTPRPAAMVDRDGFSIAEFPVRILRIPAETRRDLASKELDVLSELQAATIGGLISGTLTFTSDQLSGWEELCQGEKRTTSRRCPAPRARRNYTLCSGGPQTSSAA